MRPAALIAKIPDTEIDALPEHQREIENVASTDFPKYDDPTPKKPGVSEEAKEVKPPVLPILENED